ncbi:peroxisomal membrane protein pex14 [Irineochytrium annulatum]|nr:peroxisomal membrane protein pex14 [Irineochytrium annulatum]
MAIREETVALAVKFLKDPKVQQSTLAKRIAFLESKGLSPEEVEEAVNRSKSGTDAAVAGSTPQPSSLQPVAVNQPPPIPPGAPGANGAYGQMLPPQYPYPPYPQQMMAPQPPPLGWKDYTLGAIGVAAVGYGVFELGKKYLSPFLVWPTEAKLAADQKSMEKQLDLTNSAISEAKDEAVSIGKKLDAHGEKVGTALDALKTSLQAIRESDERRDTEIKSIREDVEAMKLLVPKILEKAESSQNSVMADLQNEIKSLKNLLLNRRVNAFPVPAPQPTASVPSPVPSNAGAVGGGEDAGGMKQNSANAAAGRSPSPFGKPVGIPAWQLAAGVAANGVNTTSSSSGEKALFAYHKVAHQKLLDALENLSDDQYYAHAGLCFRSISGVVNHVGDNLIMVDKVWATHFTGDAQSKAEIIAKCTPLFMAPYSKPGDESSPWELCITDRAEAKRQLIEGADALKRYVDSLPDDVDLEAMFEFNRGGVKLSLPLGKTLLHVLPHLAFTIPVLYTFIE